jgi:hypothetical protein
MKCPHCTVTVHCKDLISPLAEANVRKKNRIDWEAHHTVCPHCGQLIIWLVCKRVKHFSNGMKAPGDILLKVMSWPQSSERPVPDEVPDEIARDFTEAVRVLPISAQSSAAITRRTLQQILRDYAQTKKKDLYDQIQEVLDTGLLPSSLAQQLHAVRVIGNFAAHPLKSQTTGLILPVEPNEAEWNLDVLADMFDHYFVKPAQTNARISTLNQKLVEAGKPPLT